MPMDPAQLRKLPKMDLLLALPVQIGRAHV